MDEQKNNQDLTVGLDGEMTEGSSTGDPKSPPASITEPPQKVAAPETSGPEINTIAPPPLDESVHSQKKEELVPQQNVSSGGVVKAPDDSVSMSTPPAPAISGDKQQAPLSVPPKKNDVDAVQEEMSHVSQNTATKPRPHEHRNNKKLAIFMTILVAALLAVGAIVVYIYAQDNATLEQPSTETIVLPEESLPVNDENVENTLDDASDQAPSVDSDNPPADEEPSDAISSEPSSEPSSELQDQPDESSSNEPVAQ